jgi:hypothetical protein
MATINCPKGCRWITRFGDGFEWERRDVEIWGDICDHSESCDFTGCEYHNASAEGTRKYVAALNHSRTADGIFAAKAYAEALRAKHPRKDRPLRPQAEA